MTLVSVLVPVYNASRFLAESLESILSQSFSDFELILVDDASTDSSLDIIRSYVDSRIRLISLDHNLGIGGALNAGLAAAKGKYLVRMDADDIAHPDRLAKQVAFMEDHPAIGVSGTLAAYFDGEPFNRREKNSYLKPSLLLYCPFAHPTVIIRKKVMDDHGLTFSGYLEDYELWIKLSSLTDFGLLPEVLLRYRRSEWQFTANNFEKRNKEANRLRVEFAQSWIGRTLSMEEQFIVADGTSQSLQPSLDLVNSLCQELFCNNPWQSPVDTRRVLKKLFLKNFYRSLKGLPDILAMFRSPFLSLGEKVNLAKKTKLVQF